MSFKDHFSEHSSSYAKYRLSYPLELFEYLASRSPSRRMAWDCAAGTGQATQGLAPLFDRVIATDASREQIANARPLENVVYRVSPAERTDIPSDSIDLITVAQAVHWFDFDRFFGEAKRVGRKGAIIAVWATGTNRVSDEVDRVVKHLYSDIVGRYWPKESIYWKRTTGPSHFRSRSCRLPSSSSGRNTRWKTTCTI